MKKPFIAFTFALALTLVAGHPSYAQKAPEVNIYIDPTLPWSERMALSEIHRLQMNISKNLSQTSRKWGYLYGLMLPALNDVAKRTGKDVYYQLSQSFAEMRIKPDGTIHGYDVKVYNIDHISAGNVLFYVYERNREERYKKAMDLVRSQLDSHPRTFNGGFWHKKIYTHQMWLDGLYMCNPFYAHYEQLYGDGSNYEDIARQFIIMERQARDFETGLLYHGWDSAAKMFWADPITGLSKNFWGRGVGWYAMGLVDTLDYFPEDHPRRDDLIAILKRLADAMAKVQDPSGLWWQVLNMPNRKGNYKEATVTNMFTYSVIKGVRKGYLDPSYLDMAAKAWQGIHTEFITVDDDDHEVHMDNSCGTAGLGSKVRADGTYDQRRDGTFEYYASEKIRFDDGKATAPFIRAALDIESMDEWLSKDMDSKIAMFELQ